MAIFLPGFGGVNIFDTPFAGQEHLLRRETAFRPPVSPAPTKIPAPTAPGFLFGAAMISDLPGGAASPQWPTRRPGEQALLVLEPD